MRAQLCLHAEGYETQNEEEPCVRVFLLHGVFRRRELGDVTAMHAVHSRVSAEIRSGRRGKVKAGLVVRLAGPCARVSGADARIVLSFFGVVGGRRCVVGCAVFIFFVQEWNAGATSTDAGVTGRAFARWRWHFGKECRVSVVLILSQFQSTEGFGVLFSKFESRKGKRQSLGDIGELGVVQGRYSN